MDEIFHYLQQADKPCVVAIDEFQVIANYPEKTVEATLRKRIQQCHNAHFIYSGSKRHTLTSSSVQGAIKVLLDRDLVTSEDDAYYLYDRFMEIWLSH